MGDLFLANQGKPVTPASGNLDIWPDNTKKALAFLDDAGRITQLQSGIITNSNIATVSPGAANAYITGSALALGAGVLQVGARARWRLGITKGAAGTGTPIWTVVFGTNGTVADAVQLTFTQGGAGTAVADTAMVDIECVVRVSGASGILAGIFQLHHALATTGFASTQMNILSAVSGAFNMTVPSSILGLCVNAGTGGAWSIETVASTLTGC